MKKQLIRISVLQSSKIMTALYVLMGFIYALIGIPMIIFGSDQVRIIGIIYRNRSPTGSENWRS